MKGINISTVMVELLIVNNLVMKGINNSTVLQGESPADRACK